MAANGPQGPEQNPAYRPTRHPPPVCTRRATPARHEIDPLATDARTLRGVTDSSGENNWNEGVDPSAIIEIVIGVLDAAEEFGLERRITAALVVEELGRAGMLPPQRIYSKETLAE